TSINDTDKQHLGTYNEKINEAIGDKAVQLHKSPFAPTGMRKTDVDLWMPTVTLNDEDAKIKPRMLLHLNSQFVSNSFLVDGAGPSIFASAVPEVYFYKEDATPDDLVLTFNNMHDKDLRGQTQDVGLVDRLWKNKVNRFFYGKYVTMEMLLSYFDFDGAELNNTITINDNRYTLVKLDKFNLTRQTTTSVELIQQ
ncbi:hypothetical protein ACQVTS_29560, partial [Bacillus mycoides]|uniref:hypothetical protein n=1 Tax=Bacillus mycoides TaxID=1405 RepID=UPI003D646563